MRTTWGMNSTFPKRFPLQRTDWRKDPWGCLHSLRQELTNRRRRSSEIWMAKQNYGKKWGIVLFLAMFWLWILVTSMITLQILILLNPKPKPVFARGPTILRLEAQGGVSVFSCPRPRYSAAVGKFPKLLLHPSVGLEHVSKERPAEQFRSELGEGFWKTRAGNHYSCFFSNEQRSKLFIEW